MLLELRDPEAYIRSLAALALTRTYADSAGLAPSAVADLLLRATDDPSPAVRINAIRSLGSYVDPPLASVLSAKLTRMLDDPLVGVQVQAAETLGELGGPEAVKGARPRGRRQGHVRAPPEPPWWPSAAPIPPRSRQAAAGWRRSGDWRDRAAAAEGAALAGPGRFAGVPGRPRRPCRRRRASRRGRTRLTVPTRRCSRPPARCSAPRTPPCGASRRMPSARAADPADLSALAGMYAATGRDSFPDAALSALDAILAIRKTGPAAAGAGRPRVPPRLAPAAELSAPAVGRGQLARGGRALGTGAADRHRTVAAGLS